MFMVMSCFVIQSDHPSLILAHSPLLLRCSFNAPSCCRLIDGFMGINYYCPSFLPRPRSISNYPNYQTSATIEAHNIHPPLRFLDSPADKKATSTGSSPRIRLNQKLQRETFQINV